MENEVGPAKFLEMDQDLKQTEIIAIGVFGTRTMIKNKWWWELAVYCILFLGGSILIVLETADVKVFSFGQGMKYLVKDIFHLGYKP